MEDSFKSKLKKSKTLRCFPKGTKLKMNCTSITLSGRRCTRKCIENQNHCWQHHIQTEIPEIVECAICIEEVSPFNQVTLDNCKHTFCKSCIYEWLCESTTTGESNSTCPCCRTEVQLYERVYANNFGVTVGLLSSVYVTNFNIDKLSESEKTVFKFFFHYHAQQLGLSDELEENLILMDTFKKIMFEMHNSSLSSVIAFNNKVTIKQKFLKYIKTHTYSDIRQGCNCICVINYVKNNFV